jgi:transcriptional regulator with GAF, ATPase, and Fis domain
VAEALHLVDDTTREAVEEENTLKISFCRIAIVEGPEEGRTFESDRPLIRIGTAADNDFVVRDRGVSRRHLEVRKVEGGYMVVDCGSTNGLYVGTVRVREAMLRGKSRLKIGGTVLAIEPAQERITLEPSSDGSFGELVGSSRAMRELYAKLRRLAPTMLPIAVQGETGTGKELTARAIHEHSPRRDRAFVTLDCGALPPTLIESALFGHERGAFTGAERAYAGVFERAHGGTLFLDEIGELPLDLQPKLLRVLERGEIERIGASSPQRVDVRIVAATNRDLSEMVKAGKFRADLYFRLAVVPLVLPPLRARKDDIPAIAAAIFAKHGTDLERMGSRVRSLSDGAITALAKHDYPGNVRELSNVLRRAAVFAKGEALLASELPVDPFADKPHWTEEPMHDPELVGAAGTFKEAKALLVDRFERDYLRALVERHANNLSSAAREAGIARRHLLRLVEKYQIERERR